MSPHDELRQLARSLRWAKRLFFFAVALDVLLVLGWSS